MTSSLPAPAPQSQGEAASAVSPSPRRRLSNRHSDDTTPPVSVSGPGLAFLAVFQNAQAPVLHDAASSSSRSSMAESRHAHDSASTVASPGFTPADAAKVSVANALLDHAISIGASAVNQPSASAQRVTEETDSTESAGVDLTRTEHVGIVSEQQITPMVGGTMPPSPLRADRGVLRRSSLHHAEPARGQAPGEDPTKPTPVGTTRQGGTGMSRFNSSRQMEGLHLLTGTPPQAIGSGHRSTNQAEGATIGTHRPVVVAAGSAEGPPMTMGGANTVGPGGSPSHAGPLPDTGPVLNGHLPITSVTSPDIPAWDRSHAPSDHGGGTGAKGDRGGTRGQSATPPLAGDTTTLAAPASGNGRSTELSEVVQTVPAQVVQQILTNPPTVGTTVVMRLDPPALGSVVLRVMAGEGKRIRLHFDAEDPIVRDALTNSLDELARTLRAHGLSPEGISVGPHTAQFQSGASGQPGHQSDTPGQSGVRRMQEESTEAASEMSIERPGGGRYIDLFL
jgi:hypothetical protein